MLKRCECCGGKKTIIGLGMIVKSCPVCLGIGYNHEDEIKTDEKIDKLSKKYHIKNTDERY